MDAKANFELSHRRLGLIGKWLLLAEVIILFLSALFAILYSRGDISMDAISYFEISQAFDSHHWAAIVNGYWTPGYALLLSIGRDLSHAGIEREWPAARVTNVFLLGILVAAVVLLARTLEPETKKSHQVLKQIEQDSCFSSLGLSTFGVAVIIELSSGAYDVTRINPDILVGILFLLIITALMKLQERPRMWIYATLGLLCGAGYLSKAIFFPLTIVVIVSLFFLRSKPVDAIVGAILTVAVFTAVAGPYIAMLSHSKHHFSYSDAGQLNYIWLVNGFPRPPLLPLINGTVNYQKLGLKHPVHVLQTDPFITSFADGNEGTYPLWSDASYWLEGVRVPFSPVAAVSRVFINIKNLLATLGDLPFSTGCLIALIAAGWNETPWRRAFRNHWPALLLSTAMIAVYMTVEVDTRYIATALLVVYLVTLTGLRFRGAAMAGVGIPTLLLALFVGLFLRETAGMQTLLVKAAKEHVIASSFSGRPHWLEPDLQQAEAFRALNVSRPGEAVACIGSNGCDSYWLRLAGLHVVSQAFYPLSEIHRFWQLSPVAQQRVLEQLATTEATVAISTSDINAPLPGGWSRLGESDVVVKRLPQP